VQFGSEKVTISKRLGPSLADAIAYADMTAQDSLTQIPQLNSEYKVLAIAKHHFLLQVPVPAHTTFGCTDTHHADEKPDESIY
jgi:hypothetical protein